MCTSFNKLFILSEYFLNTDEITKKYCENITKPKLKCKGKCHLKKILNSQDNQEKKSNKNIKEINETQIFSNNSFLQLSFFKNIILDCSINYSQNYNFKIFKTIFHPPVV